MTDGIFPGMIIATIGTIMLIAVAVSSFAIARRHLKYEVWYAVHFTAYAAIALAFFHEVPAGNELDCTTRVRPNTSGTRRAPLLPRSSSGTGCCCRSSRTGATG